jgi:mannose-1-phosphate guanylyltransferase
MCFEAEDPKSCGILEVDESGVMLAFHEKVASPPGNFASGAVFLVSSEFLLSLSRIANKFRNQLVDFSSDILPLYLGRFNTWTNDIYHRDIGTLPSLERARHDLLSLNKSP